MCNEDEDEDVNLSYSIETDNHLLEHMFSLARRQNPRAVPSQFS
jgi:hypothetical protein